LLIFLLAGCAGLGARKDSGRGDGETGEDSVPLPRDYVFPAGLEFRPGEFSLPEAAPGVGSITREQRDPLASLGEDAKEAVAESFREAYIDGLLRGLSLEGALGGDLVHTWPPDRALSLAQNWRSREAAPNSWGLPSLVLAVRGAGSGEVHIVRGRILDRYGTSGGRDRANGAAGYGAPLGEEFPYRDGIAQWFEHGLIRANAAGEVFFEERAAPSGTGFAGLSPNGAGRSAGAGVEEQFQRARQRGPYAGLPSLRADAPVGRLEIPATETLPGGTLYFQTCNRGDVLLLLGQAPDLPSRVRILAGPFPEAFLAEPPEAGLEGRLLRGLERYGLPLTDPCPAPGAEPPAGAYREAQRFTRGWMVAPPSGP
jgi:hypothetical protein